MRYGNGDNKMKGGVNSLSNAGYGIPRLDAGLVTHRTGRS